jgi:hypothetical protein
MAEPRCDTCRFWRDLHDQWAGKGECHRFPPSPSRADMRNGDHAWPQTVNRSWCGEHAERAGQ